MADRATSLDGSAAELAAGDGAGERIDDQNLSRLRDSRPSSIFPFCGVLRFLAHGQHWPDLRRPGAGADRQQNQTPGRGSNQGSAEQSASSPARNRPRGTAFSCAARPVPEFVNPMGELTTNRLWRHPGPKDSPSQYARMILGPLQCHRPGSASAADATPSASGRRDRRKPPRGQASNAHPTSYLPATSDRSIHVL